MKFENQIICGDNMAAMAGMEANSIDTIITDPPYGLGFMGKEWDTFKGGEKSHKEYKRKEAVRERCLNKISL